MWAQKVDIIYSVCVYVYSGSRPFHMDFQADQVVCLWKGLASVWRGGKKGGCYGIIFLKALTREVCDGAPPILVNPHSHNTVVHHRQVSSGRNAALTPLPLDKCNCSYR